MDSMRTLLNPTQRENFTSGQTLTLIGLAGLGSLLIALVPGVALLNFPFRLLLTMVHELGHGLAALLTGGEFIRFVVSPNGAGLAYTAGGWRLVVVPAGYLSVALFGAVLILLGRSHRWSRIAMGVIGGLLLVLSLRYGLPSVFSVHFLSGLLTTVAGIVFGALFLGVALKAAPGWIVFLLHLVAIQAGLMAFSDLVTVIGLSTRFFNMPANDARTMAELTFLPAIFWAVLWAVIALGLIGGAIWLTWLSPTRRENELERIAGR